MNMKGAKFYLTLEIAEKDGTTKTERYLIEDPLVYYEFETLLADDYVDKVRKVVCK